MSNTLSQVSTLKDLSDKEIVEGLKATPAGFNNAPYQNEFWYRFAPFVYRVAAQRCQSFKDADDFAKEITQLTFIKALKAIGNFNVNVSLNDKIFKKSLKAWLGKIANNNFNKLYAEYRNQDIDINDLQVEEPSYDLFETLFVPAPEQQPSEVMMLLRAAMLQLKEIDRHIVLTYAGEGCINNTQHISASAMKILCETYRTTSENIRQRKTRALKKIKLFCFKN
ncbi:MAG: hypothetical protein NVSMB24_38540 [Mucilaginibacter sp.]